MHILLTGASGFIGKNLQVHLKSIPGVHIEILKHLDDANIKISKESHYDLIIHLAGVNRPQSPDDFQQGNLDFTKLVLERARFQVTPPSIIFTSSTQVLNDSEYGKSKLECEREIEAYSSSTGKPIEILRLPNVYGKWARPNHNSVVATFAHLIQNDLEPKLFNEHEAVNFIYIDDLCEELVKKIYDWTYVINFDPLVTSLTAHQVHSKFLEFREFLESNQLPMIMNSLDKKLFATFQSYRPQEMWAKSLEVVKDDRGEFSEIIHIGDFNQLSFLRIKPGQTRGEHFHNTKMERFIVISGHVDFHFREIHSDKRRTVEIRGKALKSVDAIPGWWHSLENIGAEDADILVWANERFNSNTPDTYRWNW
jgi:UDP-2-acetamido-2,6-beta-L-arabino-hexul-4-ose reductase